MAQGSNEQVSLREHLAALRAADQTLAAERDQRYAEVKAAEEKALKVKETADEKALALASQIQTYKDEKANELREQISSERGRYATREDLSALNREISATIKPLAEYIQSDTGRNSGVTSQIESANRATNMRIAIMGVAVSLLVIVVYIVGNLLAAHP
jgi:hypothetical protein